MTAFQDTLKHATVLAIFSMCAVTTQVHAEPISGLANKSDNPLTTEFTPPGKLIDIGGRKMQIDCRGTGSPTVVFESGLGNSGSLDWSFVHDTIAKTTRACAYSRAGIMWSEPHVAQQVGKSVAEDLHALLAHAGEKGPFVLVGHSLGGPYSMIFTKYFTAEVAGLVFVDSSHPDQLMAFDNVVAKYRSLPFLGKTLLPARKILTGFNQLQTVLSIVLSYAPVSEIAAQTEYEALGQTLAEAGSFRRLGRRPIIVLTAQAPLSPQERAFGGETPEQHERERGKFKLLRTDMATWSSNSLHLLVPDAGHFIHIDRPDVVIAAVQSVVNSVRSHQPVKYEPGSKHHNHQGGYNAGHAY